MYNNKKERNMIKLKNVSKYYYNKGIIASGFIKVSLNLNIGEFVAITGESGSGKSTLLNVISGLDSYEEGEMYIAGQETSHYTEKDFQDYRRKYIANIFQNFNLVNNYTVYQNVELVLLLNGEKSKNVRKKVLELIKKVDLYKFRNTKVSKLSGGQKQRVAIARALAKDCPILVADEPTGSLDQRSARGIIKLLSEISHDKLVIIVTHNYEQVEEYVTRKITMHDGRILEDKHLKEVEPKEIEVTKEYKDITLSSKIKLARRNAFSILPKFLLILAVYLFIVASLMGEYSYFKKDEYIQSKSGYNGFFQNTSDTRIILKKEDKTPFTEEDYTNIKNIPNVDILFKNDILLDSNVNLTDNANFWINTIPNSITNLKGTLDYGTLPTNDDQIILAGSKDDYYLGNMKDELIGKKIYLENTYTNEINKNNPLEIVGIKYLDGTSSIYNYNNYIYASDKILDKLKYQTYQAFSTTTVNLAGHNHNDLNIAVNTNVPKGQIYIPDELNYLFKDNNPTGTITKITTSNIYYTEQLNLKITKTYNKDNAQKLLGITTANNEQSIVYINPEDYNNLYDKASYQASVFVKDVNQIQTTKENLNSKGYTTLLIKDTLVNSEGVQIIQILKTITTIALLIALFFISYFVIRLILKSRNTYFATIRMLGGTKKVLRQLLILELQIVAILAYIIFLILLYIHNINVININYLTPIIEYMKTKDYILVLVLILLLSYLISTRFSRKLFQKSATSTLNEEAS